MDRYHVPINPMLAMFAAYGFIAIIPKLQMAIDSPRDQGTPSAPM